MKREICRKPELSEGSAGRFGVHLFGMEKPRCRVGKLDALDTAQGVSLSILSTSTDSLWFRPIPALKPLVQVRGTPSPTVFR